jgi:hypothetical protein
MVKQFLALVHQVVTYEVVRYQVMRLFERVTGRQTRVVVISSDEDRRQR